jgi:hypothetical protein
VPQVFILQGANMQAAAYINPDQNDYSSYANVQQSMLLRFGIAAVWFLVLGVAQVGCAQSAPYCSSLMCPGCSSVPQQLHELRMACSDCS